MRFHARAWMAIQEHYVTVKSTNVPPIHVVVVTAEMALVSMTAHVQTDSLVTTAVQISMIVNPVPARMAIALMLCCRIHATALTDSPIFFARLTSTSAFPFRV